MAGPIASSRPSAAGGYVTTAKEYDGTNDYATRGADLTGIADGKAGTISFWMDINNNGNQMDIMDTPNRRFYIRRHSDDKVTIRGQTSGGTNLLIMSSNLVHQWPEGWVHVMIAWDLATPEAYMYIGDVSDEAAGATKSDGTIDYTRGDWSVGASTGGGFDYNGCLSEIWFDDFFIDPSVTANRRKFIDAAGKPVNLGADGSTPTGASPLIYMPGGDPADNKGTGGNFTITGNLAACANAPGD